MNHYSMSDHCRVLLYFATMNSCLVDEWEKKCIEDEYVRKLIDTSLGTSDCGLESQYCRDHYALLQLDSTSFERQYKLHNGFDKFPKSLKDLRGRLYKESQQAS